MERKENKDWKSYTQFRSFEKAFKEAIPNFDETKVSMRKKRHHAEIAINIDGAIQIMMMYLSEHSIWEWHNHFIEYFNTGKWDNNCYWEVYDSTKEVHEKYPGVYAFECEKFAYSHCKGQSDFMAKVRQSGDAGFRTVAKPDHLVAGKLEPITSTIIINNYKDTNLGEVLHDLGIPQEKWSDIFEYGEFANLEVIVDENLNIIGGKIIPHKSH